MTLLFCVCPDADYVADCHFPGGKALAWQLGVDAQAECCCCVQVVFSPYLPAGFRYFTVRQDGVRGLPPGALQAGAPDIDNRLAERGARLGDPRQAHGRSLPAAEAQGCLLPDAARLLALAAGAAGRGASTGAELGRAMPAQPCAAAPAPGGCQEVAQDAGKGAGSGRVRGAENWEPSRARGGPCVPAAPSGQPLCSGVFAVRQ